MSSNECDRRDSRDDEQKAFRFQYRIYRDSICKQTFVAQCSENLSCDQQHDQHDSFRRWFQNCISPIHIRN